MTLVLLNALLPIFVAPLLGYVAGRRGLMDNVNVRDLIVLVMNFAIPCAMFLTISKTTWPVLADQSETALMIAVVFVVSFTGSYIWAPQESQVAGMSAGAFSAAVIAEAISLSDAVRLVRSRAEQMENLYPTGYGLAATVGLTERQVSDLVVSVHSDEFPVFVGNINAPRQIVIAGCVEGMQLVLAKARAQGARKAELLDVSVPSHCPLLASVADSLRTQLASMKIERPKVTYIANVNARAVYTASGVAKDLADSIAHGVRWHDATTVAQELGCDLFLELPPGHALTDLANENITGVLAYAVTSEFFQFVLQRAKSS
jgi:malonate decarboxylase epsilon subunit